MYIEHVFPKQIIVIDDSPEQRATGIVDKNGNMIISQTRPNPIGFVHFSTPENPNVQSILG